MPDTSGRPPATVQRPSSSRSLLTQQVKSPARRWSCGPASFTICISSSRRWSRDSQPSSCATWICARLRLIGIARESEIAIAGVGVLRNVLELLRYLRLLPLALVQRCRVALDPVEQRPGFRRRPAQELMDGRKPLPIRQLVIGEHADVLAHGRQRIPGTHATGRHQAQGRKCRSKPLLGLPADFARPPAGNAVEGGKPPPDPGRRRRKAVNDETSRSHIRSRRLAPLLVQLARKPAATRARPSRTKPPRDRLKCCVAHAVQGAGRRDRLFSLAGQARIEQEPVQFQMGKSRTTSVRKNSLPSP